MDLGATTLKEDAPEAHSLSGSNEDEAENASISTGSRIFDDPQTGVVFCLQQDNIRLEQELRLAHDQLEYYSKELSCRAKCYQILESKLKNATQQNNNLLAEMARFQAAREIAENQSDDARRVAALQERLTELEQTSREMREQLFDELRITETKLSIAEDTIRSNDERLIELERSANDWRSKFEETSQENEALVRANDEVKNLESAIGEVKEEKQLLYQKLNELLDEKRQLIATRDHLSSRMDEANSQVEKLRTKVRQVSEALNENVLKMVEKENLIKELNMRIALLTRDVDVEKKANLEVREENGRLKRQVEVAYSTNIPSTSHLLDLEEPSSVVTIDHLTSSEPYSVLNRFDPLPVASSTLTANTERGETPDESPTEHSWRGDPAANLNSNGFLAVGNSLANHPNILRIRRFLHLVPHRRRPIKLYLRYVFAVYLLAVHVFVLKCLFF